MLHFVVFLLIGLAGGWLAGKIIGFRRLRLLQCLVVGVVGSLLGGFVFTVVGFHAGGLLAEIVMATLGSIALLYLLNWLTAKA